VLLPLMLALLFAQVGAQTHAYSHLQPGSPQDGLGAGARPCADCCLSAPLLSIVGAAAAPPLPRVDALVTRLAPRALPYLAIFQPPGFRSRAPPDSP